MRFGFGHPRHLWKPENKNNGLLDIYSVFIPVILYFNNHVCLPGMLWEMLHTHQWDAGTGWGLNLGVNCWLKRFSPFLLLKKKSWISGKINKSDEGLERCHTPGHMITALPWVLQRLLLPCRRRLALLTRFYWHFGHGCQQGDISVLWFCVSRVEDHLMKSFTTTC